jgi:peptidoglycan/LPS O-acetylase OafA/YrhL
MAPVLARWYLLIGLDAWLPHVLNPAHPVVLDLTLAGRAVAAAALALVVLAAIHQRKDESYAIVETRRRDGAAVIDVRQNRWRPLQLLFHGLLSVAIVAVAFALWLQTYSPSIAALIIAPIAALMFVIIVPCVLAVTRAAVRRAPARAS